MKLFPSHKILVGTFKIKMIPHETPEHRQVILFSVLTELINQDFSVEIRTMPYLGIRDNLELSQVSLLNKVD